MGNGNSSESSPEHEEESESESIFPAMVLQLEDLLWPRTEALDGGASAGPQPALPTSCPAPGCSVFLDDREVCRTTSLPSSITRVRPRSLISELRLQFHMAPGDEVSETDDFGEEETVLAELIVPVHRLPHFGAPLYLSLWLGLREGCSLDFDSALTRAQDPEAPKVRLTLYKPADWPATMPSVQYGPDFSPSKKSAKPSQRLPAPDVWGALTIDADEYSGCSGRPETHQKGPSLIEQINGLMHSLRLSNATVGALQQALFTAATPHGEEAQWKLETAAREKNAMEERLRELEETLEARRAETLASEDCRRADEEEFRGRAALAAAESAELDGLRRAEAAYAETLDAKVREVRALEVLQQGYGRANAEEEHSCQELRQALHHQQLEMIQWQSACQREMEGERQMHAQQHTEVQQLLVELETLQADREIAAERAAERLSRSSAEIAHLTSDRVARDEQGERLEREAEALNSLREDVERACREQMANEQLRHDGQQEALEQHLFGLELMYSEREAAMNAAMEEVEQQRFAFEDEAAVALAEQARVEAWAREQQRMLEGQLKTMQSSQDELASALREELDSFVSAKECSEDMRQQHAEVHMKLGELRDMEAAQEVTVRAAARAQQKQHEVHLASIENMRRESVDTKSTAAAQEGEVRRQLEMLSVREERQEEALRAKMEEERDINESQAIANQRERGELQALREEMRAAAGGATKQEMELRCARTREAELLDELFAMESAKQAADEARNEQAHDEHSSQGSGTLLHAEELQSLQERNESMRRLLEASNDACLQQARDVQASELKIRALEAQLDAARNELAAQQPQQQEEATSTFGADSSLGQSARVGHAAPQSFSGSEKAAEVFGPSSPLRHGSLTCLKDWRPVNSPRIDSQPDEEAQPAAANRQTSSRGWQSLRRNVRAQAAFEYKKPSLASVVQWHVEQQRAHGGGPPPAAG